MLRDGASAALTMRAGMSARRDTRDLVNDAIDDHQARARSPASPEPSSCVGAGKMGSAMLEGWLALGLDPKSVVAIEPQPARELVALASRGLRLNPPAAHRRRSRRHRDRGQAAGRARRGADARALSRRRHGRALDHGRPHARLPRTGAVATRRAGARDAEHAGRDRPRHHRRRAQPAGLAAPARSRRTRCWRRPARSNGSATKR